MKLLKFEQPECNDVVAGLRNLANNIEAGNYGDVHNLAWAIDYGNGDVDVGLLGGITNMIPEMFFLFSKGLKKIMNYEANNE